VVKWGVVGDGGVDVRGEVRVEEEEEEDDEEDDDDKDEEEEEERDRLMEKWLFIEAAPCWRAEDVSAIA
jgi:hypothetical protein